MLLIRPWIRMNKYRITGHHIVFFIFIVSNIGGFDPERTLVHVFDAQKPETAAAWVDATAAPFGPFQMPADDRADRRG